MAMASAYPGGWRVHACAGITVAMSTCTHTIVLFCSKARVRASEKARALTRDSQHTRLTTRKRPEPCELPPRHVVT
eukprot:913253-Prymnesium_polylepis.1